MKLYLANAMRSKPLYNWPWFIENAATLRAKGHEVVNPTEIDEELGVVQVSRHEDGTISGVRLTSRYDFDEIIARDLDEVEGCDGIVLGPDWLRSEGALMEYRIAAKCGLTVFYGVESVPSACWRTPTEAAPVELPDPILCDEDVLRHEQIMAGEQRVVDPETGGVKGSKPGQLGWVAPAGLKALGEVAGFGSSKYAPTNYRLGYKHSLSFNALLRHVLAYLDGEDTDAESHLPHLAHAAWHCLTLIQFAQDHPDLDDRFGHPAEEKDAA